MWISAVTSSPITYPRWRVVINLHGRTAWGTSARSTTPRGRRKAPDSVCTAAIRASRPSMARFTSGGTRCVSRYTPFLWFDNQAEEAVKFYTSIFKNSKIGKIARYGAEGEQVSGRPKGSVMTVEFQLEGQEFVALNGGAHFKFTEAISFVVNCK